MKNTITARGFNQEGLVDLFDNMTGRIWLPIDVFIDVGNSELAAVGSTTTVGMALDKTTDEHISYNLVLPKIVDVTKAMAVYVYYSSVNTTASKAGVFGLSMKATADGEDIGATHTLATVVADTDSTTADGLGITDGLAIAANFLASTEELLTLSLYRDANHASDNVDADIEVYGVRIDYTPRPEIKTTD
jgi:hypothetical protein